MNCFAHGLPTAGNMERRMHWYNLPGWGAAQSSQQLETIMPEGGLNWCRNMSVFLAYSPSGNIQTFAWRSLLLLQFPRV